MYEGIWILYLKSELKTLFWNNLYKDFCKAIILNEII